MTIYSQISANRWKTYFIFLIFIFLLSGLFYLIGQYFESPELFFTIGVAVSLFSAIGSYYYSDKIVLATVRARPANKKEHFNFYTVAENLAISSGLPMPKLYVIDDASLNAFATGRDPKHAVVCATTGILEKLNRTELEGVIGHELSHIKNYDILVSTIVAVLVGTVGLTSDWVFRSLRYGGRRDKNLILLILLVIALILAPIAATLIQLAVSRKREFLADASGALLTRNPDALADALAKISGDSHTLNTATSSTAHLFISNPIKKKTSTSSFVASLFSTHPPVEERLKILRAM